MSRSQHDTDTFQDLSDQMQHASVQTDDHQPQTEPSTIHVPAQSAFDIHMSYLRYRSTAAQPHSGQQEEIKTTPLFSGSILEQFGKPLLPQYGLLAGRLQDRSHEAILLENLDFEAKTHEIIGDPRVFLNVNTPWSAFICGSQGSGKSHTLSCMLENCLLQSPLSELPNPLAGLVFHYDKYSSYTSSQICEAAYLCSSGIPVKVLVSPTNLWRMKAAYENMPGLRAGDRKPEVIPLRFSEQNLDVSRMMNMMAVKEKDGPVPLYIEVFHYGSLNFPPLIYNRLFIESFDKWLSTVRVPKAWIIKSFGFGSVWKDCLVIKMGPLSYGLTCWRASWIRLVRYPISTRLLKGQCFPRRKPAEKVSKHGKATSSTRN